MRTYGYFYRDPSIPGFFGEYLQQTGTVLPLEAAPWLDSEPDFGVTTVPFSSLKVGVPLTPGKIVAVGLNYHDHARERNKPVPKTPLTWLEAPTSLLASGGAIELPYPEHRIDYEAELAIVIGRKAKNVKAADAANYIFGYTTANDVTDRTLQEAEGQFARAKGFDTFTPMGPFVYAGFDVSDVPVVLTLNGEVRQNGRTGEMIFKPAELIEFITHCTTLNPGDVIITGTPAGVGNLKTGDRIEVRIGDFAPLVNEVRNA